jgi:hypothetical protein
MEPAAKILVVDDKSRTPGPCAGLSSMTMRRPSRSQGHCSLSWPGVCYFPACTPSPYWFPGRVARAACLMQQKGAFKILISEKSALGGTIRRDAVEYKVRL